MAINKNGRKKAKSPKSLLQVPGLVNRSSYSVMDNPTTLMKILRSLITGDQLEIRPSILSAGFRAEILEINFYQILLIVEIIDRY